mgnify:CR=1 FL=1
MSLRKQSFSLLVLSGISSGISAVFLITYARATTPADFGHQFVLLNASLIAAALADFGHNTKFARDLSKGVITIGYWLVSTVHKIGISIGVAVLGCIFSAVLGGPFAVEHWLLMISSFIVTSLYVPMRATFKVVAVGTLQLIERCLQLVSFLSLSAWGERPSLIHIFLFANGITLLAACGYLARKSLLTRSGNSTFTWPWRGTLALGAGGILPLIQNLDVNVLGLVAGPAATGSYSAVMRWTNSMGIAASAYSQAALPWMARVRTEPENLRKLASASWMLLASCVACLAISLFGSQIVHLLLGADYVAAGAALSWLALGMIPAIVNQPLAGFLQVNHREAYVFGAVGACVLLQLVLVAVLGRSGGAQGAAQAYAVAEVSMFAALSAAAFSEVLKIREVHRAK